MGRTYLSRALLNLVRSCGYYYALTCISMAQMVHREYGNVYDEVNALSTLLGYKTSNAGCCKARTETSCSYRTPSNNIPESNVCCFQASNYPHCHDLKTIYTIILLLHCP